MEAKFNLPVPGASVPQCYITGVLRLLLGKNFLGGMMAAGPKSSPKEQTAVYLNETNQIFTRLGRDASPYPKTSMICIDFQVGRSLPAFVAPPAE
jgi:hypothetical protein